MHVRDLQRTGTGSRRIAAALLVVLALALGGCSSGAQPTYQPSLGSGESADSRGIPTSETAGPSPIPSPAEKKPAEKLPKAGARVVVIDPGHQAKGDYTTEPIGPGANKRKARVTTGTRGIATGKLESELVLEVAFKLRDELESKGITAILVRDTQDVSLSNSERAARANYVNADLFIRLHADGSEDRGRHGLSTLVPGRNQWTGPILADSAAAGVSVHEAVIAQTGARDLGVVERSDLSGFNWAKVPTVLVEMGFMSNADEDRKLSTDEYQIKLARGMADGVERYFARR